ncbi:transcriptional regulator [Bacillus pseudomycoides]|uniref:M56 family metallopeptidase n=1 Tax=Bacillus pseudomycoides TaxID=64104 RepID=UPI000BEFE56D|nr:M56 family metallopeptidase [Bacillus pseudomycoides]MBD5799710.1 transcriptional regulator [Bacillus pseudomycoides]MED1473978.1 M56 family metallopeptidase [Bacillus pseudomycoides]PEO42666.1 transcriptional regulator [Bacillus pseudomycoides]PEO79597.1 transcriptional regulator [Bacillus pseudomycoides]PGE00996.1 transcriptional regulator [Bacillus pseudomycoides]
MIDMFVNVYLPRFFDWVIETSIMASILVGLILCIKILLRNKLTPRWQYLLWMILIVRLLLPWSPDSSYSIYSILSYSNGTSVIFHQDPVDRIQGSTDIGDTKVITKEDTYASGSTQTAEENKKQTYNNEKQDDETFSFYTILLYIWLAGVIILSFATIIMNRRLLLYIKKQPAITDERIVIIFENCKKSMSVQRDIPLLLAGKISSPTVFGFIRPKVLLSSVHMKILDEQQLRYIFHHELAHIKRRDVGVNWLMHGLLILNWFNPILWYAYSCMREDQELACDAFALTFIDSEEQLAYGHTIISLLEHYSSYYQVPSLANLSRNKRTLKRRILMIKKFQKKSYRWSAIGMMAIITVATLSLANANAEETHPNTKDSLLANAEDTPRSVNKEDKASNSISMIIERLYGTPEQVERDFGNLKGEYDPIFKNLVDEYDTIYEEFSVAQKYLTKEEFKLFVQLKQEELSMAKKGVVQEGDKKRYDYYNLWSTEDKHRVDELVNETNSLYKKIYKHFTFTTEEAQKMVDFNIKKPAYVPEGYKIIEEKVDPEITTKKQKPIIRTVYQEEGTQGFTIYQSEIKDKNKDPWSERDFDEIQEYQLRNNKVMLGQLNVSSVKGMKMIVSTKDGKSAYQIVIFSSILNKTELEKIMLSMLN